MKTLGARLDWAYEVETSSEDCVSNAYSWNLLWWNAFQAYRFCINVKWFAEIDLITDEICPKKMQKRQNIEKNVKCGHFCSAARGNAKLMINFFGLKSLVAMKTHLFQISGNCVNKAIISYILCLFCCRWGAKLTKLFIFFMRSRL